MTAITERTYYYGEEDRHLEISTGLDLTAYSATDLTITVRLPDGSNITLTDTRTILDAASGIVRVNIDSGNLRQTGEHFVQVRATLAGQPDQKSELCSFFVDEQVLPITGSRLWAPPGTPAYATATTFERAHYNFWDRGKWS